MKPVYYLYLLLLMLGLCGPVAAQSAVTLSQAQAGNVDVGQFSILWHAEGQGNPGLDVYSDAVGTESLAGQVGVEFYPIEMNDLTVPQTAGDRVTRRALQDLVKAKGLVLARVTGAEPGTTYYVRPRSFDPGTGAGNETELAPLIAVTTAESTAFVVESRQLLVRLGGCFSNSQGTVLRLSKSGLPYPLFAVVGDSGEMDEAFFDLRRLLNPAGTSNASFSGSQDFELDLFDAGGPTASQTVQAVFSGDPVVAAAQEVVFSSSFPGLAYFSLESAGTPVQGLPFLLNIVARNAQGQVLTAFDGTVEITAAEPGALTSGTGTTAAFVNGRLNNHAVVSAVLGSVTLTATRPCGNETGSQAFVFISPALDIRFSQPVFAVNQGAASAVLTLTRTATDAAEFVLNTHDGEAQTSNPPFDAARAGTDYVDVVDAATVVSFANGETTKEVEIALLPRTGNLPNRRFSATLQAEAAGAVLTSTTVQILADDSLAPKLTLTAPGANAKISSVRPYTVVGKADDLRGIDRVEVILNGGAPVLATLGARSKNTVPFTADISPLDGANTVQVVAYDLRNNSVSVTRSFTFTTRYWLTLNRQVPAAMAATPDKAGTLALKASVAANASALTPKGAAEQRSMVVPATTLTLTATARPNHVFSHWTGLPAGADVASTVVSFVMPAGDLPPVSAVFVANPFPALVGTSKPTYQGLLLPESGTPESNATVGLVGGTLATASGSFTGKVWMDGKITSFVARLQGNGEVWFKSGKTMAQAFPFLERQLTMSWSAQGLAVQISGPEADACEGLAKLPAYSKKAPVPADLLNVGGRSGFYTLAIPAKAQTPVRAESTYPQGAGYQSLTMTNDGTVKAAGVLADGSKITVSSFLVAEDKADFFIQMATPGASTKGGSFLGTLAFAVAADSDVTATDLRWFRPAVIESTKAPTWLYTDGWPAGLKLDAMGAQYDKTVNVQTALELPEADEDGNARLHFSDGKLASDLAWLNFNIAASAVKKLPASDKTFTLSVVQGTGLISGTFTPNWADAAKALPKFQGIIVQKGLRLGGHGYFLSNANADRDPESGAVSLSEPELPSP